MKLIKLPEITPKTFYTVGKYMFLIIAVLGLVAVVDKWSSLESYQIFSSLANTIFYFVLSGFFSYLQKKEVLPEVTDEDILKMNQALDKLNLKNG